MLYVEKKIVSRGESISCTNYGIQGDASPFYFIYINLYPVGVMMLLIMSRRNVSDGPRGMIANKLCPWVKTSSLLIHRGCTCSC